MGANESVEYEEHPLVKLIDMEEWKAVLDYLGANHKEDYNQIVGVNGCEVTFLIWAIIKMAPECVIENILSKNVNVNTRIPEDVAFDDYAIMTRGATALLFALRVNSKPTIIQILLDAGADISIATANGTGPLHLVGRYSSYPALVNLFVDLGADLNDSNKEGCTPLMISELYGNVLVFEEMLKHKKLGKN